VPNLLVPIDREPALPPSTTASAPDGSPTRTVALLR
jgi:hypothetical protein